MRNLLLALIFSIQAFGATLSDIPTVKDFLERVPKPQRKAISAVIVGLISQNPQATQEVGKCLAEYNDVDGMEPSSITAFVEGVIAEYNSIHGAAAHAAVVSHDRAAAAVVAHPPAVSALPPVHALSPTELKAQRLEQFYAVVKDIKNLDQTFESLAPYIQPDIAKLEKFPLETFDEKTWSTILADVPANMATGGVSGPSRFNKALAVIEQYLGLAAQKSGSAPVVEHAKLVAKMSTTAASASAAVSGAAHKEIITKDYDTAVRLQRYENELLPLIKENLGKPFDSAKRDIDHLLEQIQKLELERIHLDTWAEVLKAVPNTMREGVTAAARSGANLQQKAVYEVKQLIRKARGYFSDD